MYAVACLGIHFGGGGGSKYFCKSGGICMAQLLGGFGGMLPREFFLKMLQFGAF